MPLICAMNLKLATLAMVAVAFISCTQQLVLESLPVTAEPGPVTYEKETHFKNIHQMISTVEANVGNTESIDVIKALFPMGSMTGAPKIRAMELIEQYESSKRGLYSGCIGYFSPNGDFDFNVVIRSILYNEAKPYISFSVGSAITAKATPEFEYQECLLKAKAMRQVLEEN